MAPTRGFRRALIAVAATIVAARFSVFQRAPKPAPVRTPPVRVQPAQNTTHTGSTTGTKISRRRTTEYASRRRRDTVPVTLTTSMQLSAGAAAA